MYGKEHEQTYHYLQNIHHHLIQPKQYVMNVTTKEPNIRVKNCDIDYL
jgi:hypothetical protein